MREKADKEYAGYKRKENLEKKNGFGREKEEAY
jgi:hypothetical protein